MSQNHDPAMLAKAETLTEAMEAANNRRRNKLVKRTPSAKVVQKWIDSAGELEPVVKH